MKPIKVVDYDPSWPRTFAAERSGILLLLGDLVEEVFHVGSTAVPGLAAKPKIDIDAVLRSDELLAEAVERVRTQDYVFHGDPYDEGMWTFTVGRGSYGTRLYLCVRDNPLHVRRLLFRDYLRAHPGAAEEYAALKRRLAAEADGNWDFYTGGKSDFVDEIVARAALPSPLAGEGVERSETDEGCSRNEAFEEWPGRVLKG